MMAKASRYCRSLLAAALFFLALLCTSCATQQLTPTDNQPADATKQSRYLVAVEEEPDTVDFQCTSIHYTIATNVFDRLVEMKANASGEVGVTPSLAESWEESEDGRSYTFHLRKGVTFSNGSALTSSDVLYSFTRLLTHPDSCNQDIVEIIKGAKSLESGDAKELEGFKIIDDHTFTITLEQPFEAFLACLSMPGASIMDKETTEKASDQFGKDSAHTIGTGPFVLQEWEPQKGMKLGVNNDCWAGPPLCGGLDLRFLTEQEEIRTLFDNGELDILDLDDLDDYAEYYVHGDVNKDRIHEVPQIGISYIALNESVSPLDDARVRKALQVSLDRDMLLNVVYSGRGSLENGIFSRGLYGHNASLPPIEKNVDEAKRLLADAGYPDGFDLTFSVKSSSTSAESMLAREVANMWSQVGVHTEVKVIPEEEFMSRRKGGTLECYTATWTADYNDPDNYIYTFFGNRANTTFRSLCYPREDVMERVTNARTITDSKKRIDEYHDLEKTIVQDDAAWVPLFSRTRLYVTSERVKNFHHAWNGSVKNVYREMEIDASS